MLDKNLEVFITHVSSLSLELKTIIDSGKKAWIVLLLVEKVTISAKYLDFADIFSKKWAKVLLKQTKANKHIIMLEKSKQLYYGPIYSLRLKELKILKTYIKTNLINSFIRASELPTYTLILFICKLNSSFWLCPNYEKCKRSTYY